MKIYRGTDLIVDNDDDATDSDLLTEATTRANADAALQADIDAIVVSSGVTSVAALTGVVTAAGLKTALSLPTNTNTDLAARQPLDSDLSTIAAMAPPNDSFIQRKSGSWTTRTMAQLKTDLALVKGDVGLGSVDNTSDTAKFAAKFLTATAALNFPSIAANVGTQDLTITVTGAAVGDAVFMGPPSTPTAGLIFNAWVSATDTVTIRATNITAGAIDPASATWRAVVMK